MTKKKVLVTGATGFIGRHCLPFLWESDCEIHTISRTFQKSERSEQWHLLDIFDSDAVNELVEQIKPSHLLHLAWEATPGVYWNSKENFDWVRASLSLYKSFLRCGGRRVVTAGTCAEYDWDYGWCSETITPLSPQTIYGSCKHALQLMLSSYAQQYGLSSAWGRIFFLYGCHEYPVRLVPYVIKSLLEGKKAECSSGRQKRDFLHVSDTASAFVSLLFSDVQGSVNIASGNVVSISDVIQKIATIIGRPDLIEMGAKQDKEGEPSVLLADTKRLNQELSWYPSIDLNEGLKDVVTWWQSRMVAS